MRIFWATNSRGIHHRRAYDCAAAERLLRGRTAPPVGCTWQGFGVRGKRGVEEAAKPTAKAKQTGASVSNSDSFIDEVTEEVQRDKLYAFFRKYGWIPVVLVIAIVAGAAYNEWSKSKARQIAQANGDAIAAALTSGAEDAAARAQALANAAVEGGARIVADMLRAGELHAAGDAAGAIAALAPYTVDATLDAIYRDLAVLKTAMIGSAVIAPEDRIAQLAGIAAPGAPYRLLAEEQIATAQIEMGDIDVAISGLRAIAQDVEATEALRRRALQMIVALGADPVAE